MPATVRDILLMIRARDEASRAINGISNSMRRAAAQADASSARAQAAAARGAAAQARATGATKEQVAALQNSAKNFDAEAKAVQESTKKREQLAGSMQNVGQMMEVAGAAMIIGGAATLYGLKNAVDVAAEWDKQVRLTFTQVDKKYKPSLKELGDIGIRISSKIATPFEGIQEALFDVFSSTEANLPQAEHLTTQFAKAAVAGQVKVQDASRATIGIMNAFKIPFEDVNEVLDVQFTLVREGIGTYKEWSEKLGNVTPSAARAGQSIETMGAALATATRMGQSTARASTSVARAFDAMSNPKTEARLQEIGVATRDAKGNFRPLVDVMSDWRKELEKLPPKERVGAILDILKGAGSTIEARRFLQGILLTKGGLELFQNQVETFSKTSGNFESAYNDMAGSVSSKSQLLHNNWMILKLAIGQALTPAFLTLVGIIQKVLDWFNKLPEGTKSAIAQFLLWGSVLGIVGGVITVLLGALVMLAASIATAGAAILPVVGVMAGIAAVVTLVVAGIIALGYAFYTAYQNSQPFRDLINSIIGVLQLAWQGVVNFAKSVYESFQTYVMPPLRELWGIIETQVLPAITELVNWFRDNMLPVAKTVGDVMKNQVASAMKTAGDVIKGQVIPAVKEIISWWNQHKNVIMPVITFLGKMLAVMIIVAAFILGTLAKAVISNIALLIRFGRTALSFVLVPIQIVIGIFRMWWGVIKATIKWFEDLVRGIVGAMLKAKMSVMSGVNSIRSFFSGAAGWLVSAGRNMVQGLINGISGMIGAAANKAAELANRALGAAKSALGIASPSKKFRDIGKNVIRGFIQGISGGNLKKVSDQMFRLSQAVLKSIRDADISKKWKKAKLGAWTKRLNKDTKKLEGLAKKRDALTKRIANAEKKYNDLVKTRDELASKIGSTLRQQGDMTSFDEDVQKSAPKLAAGLKSRLQSLREFQANLRNLAKRGFDKETIANLAAQGVEGAGTVVNTLAKSTDRELQEINTLQKEIRKMADSTGKTVAGDLYNAGINAAKGFVNGLKSQMKSLTSTMNQIANALVKAIRQKLGIKSPSTVFAKLGINTAQGFVNGYTKHMNLQQRDLARATMFMPATNSTRPAGTASNLPGYTGQGKQITNNITVHTNEIDPRKTSAELGWELAGRMG